MNQTRALWTVARGRAELRPETPRPPGEGEVLIRTLFSGLSRGTERLVFEGAVPAREYGRMRAPLMAGDFPFPVKYGYAAVGVVEAGEAAWLGRTVFALAPHQERQTVPLALASEVPAEVPARRAALAANMETALNAVWDAGAGPGDAITVVGAGVVGLLIARLCARLPGARVQVVDVTEARAGAAAALGCRFHAPDEAAGGTEDIVFHVSSAPAGLAEALRLGGFEARIVEVSWYGDRLVPAPLGDAFHSQRLTLTSSQVGAVATSRRPRWDCARRRETALRLLADPALDALITGEVAFADLPAALPRLLAPDAPGLQTIVRY